MKALPGIMHNPISFLIQAWPLTLSGTTYVFGSFMFAKIFNLNVQPGLSYYAVYTRGGEPIYYHEPHELCIIAGRPQNQLISS